MAISNSNNPGDALTGPDDKASVLGRFSWVRLGKTCIPCLLRTNDEKYVPVRIAEMKILSTFLQHFNSEMLSCITVESYKMTKAECSLLNTINYEHSNLAFGKTEFCADRDYMVKYEDLNEYYNFLDTCYAKLTKDQNSACEKCGFIRINRESVVPFVTKNNVKYVPLFYFVGEMESLEMEATFIERWDLAYLKFCCKVHGIKNEFVSGDQCQVTSLENIKIYFPEDTTFEDYWPTHIVYTGPTVPRTNGFHSWVHLPSYQTPQPSVPTPSPPVNITAQPVAQTCSTVNVASRRNSSSDNNTATYQNRNTYPNNTSVCPTNSGRVVQEMPQVTMNGPPRQNTNQGNPITVPTSRPFTNPMQKATHHYYPATSINSNSVKNGTQLHQPLSTCTVASLSSNSYPPHNNMHAQNISIPPSVAHQNAAAYRIDNILSNNQSRNQTSQNVAVNVMNRASSQLNIPTRIPNGGAPDNEIIDLLSPPSSPLHSENDSAVLPPIATPQHRNIMSSYASQIPEVVHSKTSTMLPHRIS